MLRLSARVLSVVLVLFAGVAVAAQAPSGPNPAGSPQTAPTVATVASSFDGVSIHFRVEGSGSPAVVLIHCWMCDSGIWDNVVPELAKNFRVITLDLPGHGSSGKKRTQWSMAAFGADVKSVVDVLHLDKVILVGHSMGGAVMLEAAALMPGKVVGMIGVDTMLDADKKTDPKEIDALLAQMKADFRGTANQLVRMIAGKSSDPAVIDRVAEKMSSGDPAIGLALMDSLQHYDVKAGMERAHAPMVGINSTMRPTNVAANRKCLPRYELLPLPEGVGHFPQVEAPQAFNALLERAIALLGGAAAEVLVPRGARPVLDGVLSPAVGDRPAPGVALDYLGQPPPGDTAVVFAQGVVSDGHVHGRLVVSPDGRELLWTTVSAPGGQGIARIMHVARTGNGWTAPQAMFLATQGMTANPLFSPDGTKLYFNLTSDLAKGWQTQSIERTEQGWSEPKESGFLLNPSSSFTKSGRVYYTAQMAGKPWNMGTYVAEYTGNAYANPRALPASINSPFMDYSPFVAPDESYLMFSSSRPSLEEDMFLHISFRKPDGTWSTPRRMNEALGFAGNARFPSLSPDGSFLFFCGDDGNVYWVRSKVIDRLRDGDRGDTASVITVPQGRAPVVDGVLSPGEWGSARRFEIPGGEMLLQSSDGSLYVGLRTTGLAVGSICIARGDEIAVLHSSAALGTAIYSHSANGWRLTRPFAWRCRNQADTAKLQAERTTFLQQEHWLANTALTGTPGEMEYQIAMPTGWMRLAVTFNRVSDHAHLCWPTTLTDDSLNPDLTGGDAPETAQFSPGDWMTVRASP